MKNNWKLENINIRFTKGYAWEKEPAKKKDRYTGNVTFSDDESQEFTLNIDDVTCNKYLNLISDAVIKTATELGSRISVEIKEQTKSEK